jgi:hypothetical protein
MRKLMIMFCAVLLTACTTPPRTSQELREGNGNSIGLSKREAHDLKREFSLVVNDVRRESTECLRFAYTTSVTQGGVPLPDRMTFYNVSVKMIGSGKAEMTMQQDRKPRAKHDPEGGYYVFVADIEKIAANRTRMTMYGSSFFTWRPIFEAIKGWGEGKDIKCPETP